MSNQPIESKDTRDEMAKKAMEEKQYRTKLYHENKKLYKKVKADFVYDISQHFRQKRKNKKKEMKQLDKETLQAYRGGEMDEY